MILCIPCFSLSRRGCYGIIVGKWSLVGSRQGRFGCRGWAECGESAPNHMSGHIAAWALWWSNYINKTWVARCYSWKIWGSLQGVSQSRWVAISFRCSLSPNQTNQSGWPSSMQRLWGNEVNTSRFLTLCKTSIDHRVFCTGEQVLSKVVAQVLLQFATWFFAPLVPSHSTFKSLVEFPCHLWMFSC
jgi:hypothetical protein